MDEHVPFGRFGMLGRPKSSQKSWWLGLNRVDFQAAARAEHNRMNQTFRAAVTGQNRVVGTHHGKI